jgi:sugar (pentulose or hexulose) kinase
VGYACASAAAQVAGSDGRMTDLRLGGGLAGSKVWSETLAAVAGVPVHRLRTDASPLGAAMLAGLGIGVWADAGKAAAACVSLDDVPAPTGDALRRYRAAQLRYDLTVEALLRLGERTRELEATSMGAVPDGAHDERAAQ